MNRIHLKNLRVEEIGRKNAAKEENHILVLLQVLKDQDPDQGRKNITRIKRTKQNEEIRRKRARKIKNRKKTKENTEKLNYEQTKTKKNYL